MYTDKKQFKEYLSCNPEFSLSKGSVDTYVNYVHVFFRDNEVLTQESLNEYYKKIRDEKKPSYVNLLLNAIKHYCTFKKLDIKIPKSVKGTRDDTKDIIEHDYLFGDIFDCIEYNEWYEKEKVKAILVFMFYTGLRLRDYEKLHRKDFTFKDKYGYVNVFIQKNNFYKKIFFPESVFKYLVTYFDISPEINNAFNLEQTTIRNIFKKLNTLVSDKHLHPHMMRGSAITHLYKNCEWTVEEISKLIGIKPETIINNYLKMTMDDIESKYADKMKGK